jgi:hypothetical protein
MCFFLKVARVPVTARAPGNKIEPLAVGGFEKFENEAGRPIGCACVHAFYQRIRLLSSENLLADHPLHETPPSNAIWLACEHIGDTSISSQEGISIFKFPERLLKISCRDLISFTFSTTLTI